VEALAQLADRGVAFADAPVSGTFAGERFGGAVATLGQSADHLGAIRFIEGQAGVAIRS
jgi:3-hydroxyisobutyrate dehydrogenase-like beta-hydroxyacid dehydrogenase